MDSWGLALYWHHCLEVVTTTILRMLGRADRMVGLWESGSVADYMSLGIDNTTSQVIVQQKRRADTQQLTKELKDASCQLLPIRMEGYPVLLKQIHRPPPLLYYQGDLNVLAAKRIVTIVGTRNCSEYGLNCVASLIAGLKGEVDLVVSGGAYGIDAAVAKNCLHQGIPHCIVLGSGLQKYSPRTHFELFERVKQNGIILSEYLPTMPGNKYTFPERNRLISGLSPLTIVVEAPAKSGALITADFAIQQNRELGVVPGPITYPHCIGNNNLLKQGARPITSATDIIEYWQRSLAWQEPLLTFP